MDEALGVSKCETECNFTHTRQTSSSADGGLSREASFPADGVTLAEKGRPPPSPPSEWLDYPPQAETHMKAFPRDPQGVDAAGAAAKSRRSLPVGALTPNKAVALRKDRVVPVLADNAVPAAQRGSAPPQCHSEAPLNTAIVRSGCTAHGHANEPVSPKHIPGASRKYSFYISGANPTARSASPPHAKRSEDPATLTGHEAFAAKGAPRLASPRGARKATTEGGVPAVPAWSAATRSDGKSLCHKDVKSTQCPQSFVRKVDQGHPSPSPAGTLGHRSATSPAGRKLQRQNSASRSIPSVLVCGTTAVPHPEKKESGDQLALLVPGIATHTADGAAGADDAWEDMEEEDFYTAKKARVNGLKRDFSFYGDETGLPGLWRTHSLFPDMFAAITKDANDAPDTDAAPGTTGPMARAPSIFISVTLPGDALEVQDLYSDDSSENGTEAVKEGGGKQQAAPPPPGGAGLTPCPPPVASVDGASAALRPATFPVVPPTARDACIPPRPVPVLHSPLTLDAELLRPARHPTSTGRTSPRAAKPLRMRYLCPQPEMAGPPLPPLSKADPRRLFGGNCLADAPWVSSPCDADLDEDVPISFSASDTPTVPESKQEVPRDDVEVEKKDCVPHREAGRSKVKDKNHGDIISYFVRKMQS
ncbi:nascent polypeptide-associated complex subunit alpha [Strigomonas culicis]|uniref:Nascent polypeptide-associated complex subunit alpha n=1 Tax=Strigomonas culicis TaxID=28005 RepID=S9V613_9TRYP|nr:nascent polypeptide-associated complex subunit alpha [Strigomonas culicis]|eukprot:EPY18350.1 nascent polypeptide-associated complex subunit alpha [Strigomonas culicis]